MEEGLICFIKALLTILAFCIGWLVGDLLAFIIDSFIKTIKTIIIIIKRKNESM
jgi:hypothetical protein